MIPVRLGYPVLALALLAGAVLVSGRADAARAQTAETVYRLRPDARMCPSPACGGFWASRVNGAATIYVAAVGLQAFRAAQQARIRAALPQGHALIAGAIVPYRSDAFPKLSSLRARSAWLAAGAGGPAGTVYRVVDTGIRCIRAPCFSLRATLVNGTRSLKLSELDLEAAGMPAPTVDRVEQLLRTGRVLVTGETASVSRSDWPEPGRRLTATQVWLPAQ